MTVAKLTVCAIDLSQGRAVKEQYPTKALVLIKNAKAGTVLRKDEIFKPEVDILHTLIPVIPVYTVRGLDVVGSDRF